MDGRRVVRVLVVVAVLLGGAVAGGVAAALQGPPTAGGVAGPAGVDAQRDAGGPPPTGADFRAPVGPPKVDTATTRIRVHPNGSATWTVEIRTRLANDTDRADYERFQEQFRADTERYLGPFRERMTDLVAAAGNVTGRAMTARSFAASTRVQQTPRQWGIVEYRFHWAGFADRRDGTLHVGDVFESGYYLTDGDSLVVEAPAGYRVADPRPAPERRDDRAVRWVGPIDFADQRPAVSLVPAGTTTGDATADGGATTGADGTTPGTGETTPADGDGAEATGGGLNPVVLGAVLLIIAGGAAAVLARRRSGAGDAGPPDAASEREGGADGAAGAGTAAGTDAGDDAAAALVTNEEQVVDLLRSNGGRMRQADIADRLDWSAPKTSRVLSDMADEGSIEKLRLGNENIIDLVEDGA